MKIGVIVNIYPDLNQMVIVQEMGCNNYMATVVAVDPTPASVGGASPRGTVRRTQNIGRALVESLLSEQTFINVTSQP